MQLGSVYLYPNRIDVYTNLDDWVNERYRRVYNRNLKVYRGVNNRVELRVKNSDQKPTNISNRVFVFRLVAFETQELLFKKDCQLIDAGIGRLALHLSADELQGIEEATYQYSLSVEIRDNRGDHYIVVDSQPVYTDTQYGVRAFVEVLNGISVAPAHSQEVSAFRRFVDPNPADDFIISGLATANSQLTTASSLHTFQLYFTHFTGRVTLQASIDNGGDPQTWVDIESYDYVDASLEYINIVGKYTWFRFRHQPNDNGILGDFVVNQTISGDYIVTVNDPGHYYERGNQVVIKGHLLGGEQRSNDLIITITGVTSNGGIATFTHQGRSYNGVQQFIVGPSRTSVGSFDKFVYR